MLSPTSQRDALLLWHLAETNAETAEDLLTAAMQLRRSPKCPPKLRARMAKLISRVLSDPAAWRRA